MEGDSRLTGGLTVFTIAIIVLAVIIMTRSGNRWHRRPRVGRQQVAELERRFEEQQAYVQSLEDRVLGLEEGLDFTERMLAERTEAARATA